MSLKAPHEHSRRRRVSIGLAVSAAALLLTLGIFASNGWLPRTDPLTGKKFGWFGKPLPQNVASVWNPFAAPAMPSGTPQLSKEYIYAGSRLLAVEDANAGGTATPTPTPLESDVAPRFWGDGIVLATDRTIVQRFATGLDCQEPGTNEVQRADAAPRSTLGDGIVTSGDVTQANRYSTGLDPPTAVGGPLGQDNCGGGESFTSGGEDAKRETESLATAREIRVQGVAGGRGQTVTLPVFLRSDAGEMAVAFTLEYDSARLANPRLSLSGDLPASAMLTANTNRPGKIGILVDALEPFSTTPRELRVVLVTLDVRPTAATGSVQLSLTSSLARQSVADGNANLVPTNYTNGSMSITN